jgi:CheY-like chemotaxis protein
MEKLRVLIVDDNESTITLISALLRTDFEIDTASDGAEAIQKLQTRRYSAVLLDLRMPDVDGFDVLDFVRENQPALLPRVLIVTAVANDDHLERASGYGVSAVVRKPFEIDRLLEDVRKCAGTASLDTFVASGMLLWLSEMLR